MSSRSLSSPKLNDFTAVEHPLSFLSRRIGANFTRHSPLCKGKQGGFGGVLSKIPLNPPLPKGDFKTRDLCEFSQSREENLKLTPMRAGGNPERSGHPLLRPHLLLRSQYIPESLAMRLKFVLMTSKWYPSGNPCISDGA